MDLRSLINTINLLEGITMAEIQTAVGQEKDEQIRAGILNDLAWKHNLPGLYDPISGYFVRKQSMPSGGRNGGESSYSISSTAREADTQALAKLGLVPRNAKTSDLGGLVGTGSVFGSKEDNAKAAQAVIDQSAKVDTGARDARGNVFVKRRLMQLKNLVARIRGQQSPSSAFQQPPAAVGQSGQKPGEPFPAKGWDSQVRESIKHGLTNILNEDFGIEMEADATPAPAAAPAPAAKFEKEIALIRKIMADLQDNNDPNVIAALMDAQKALDEIEKPVTPTPAAGNDKEKDRARMKELVDITKKSPMANDMEESIAVKEVTLTDAEKYAAIRDRLLQIESAIQEAETPAERRARRNGQPAAAPAPAPAPAPAAAGPANPNGAGRDPNGAYRGDRTNPAPSVASKPPVSQSGQQSAPATGEGDYVIKKGDTLGKLAAANGTTVDALMKLNPQIKNPNLIYAGKTLKLKAGGTDPVVSADELGSQKFPMTPNPAAPGADPAKTTTGADPAKTTTGGTKTNLTKYYADEMAEMEKLIAKYASDPEMAADVKAAQTQLDALKATAK